MRANYFSDEKWFQLDGPDDWRSYILKSAVIYLPRNQKKSGCIMVQATLLSNRYEIYKCDIQCMESNTCVYTSSLSYTQKFLYYAISNDDNYIKDYPEELIKKINDILYFRVGSCIIDFSRKSSVEHHLKTCKHVKGKVLAITREQHKCLFRKSIVNYILK